VWNLFFGVVCSSTWNFVHSSRGRIAGQFAFLNIENIHTMRESYQKLGKLLQRPCGTQFDATWNSAVEATGWLLHIREVLRGVLAMVTQVECNKGSILSHCTPALCIALLL
jgi:hypothetical protein